ncbi:MAG: type II secretion system F family protein [Chakrabartia sp.]
MTLFGFALLDLITLLSMIAALGAMAAVYGATSEKHLARSRIKAIEARRDELKTELLQPVNQKRRRRLTQRSGPAEQLRQIMDRFRLVNEDQLKAAELQLWQAGLRSNDLAVVLILSRIALPLVLGGMALLTIFFLNLWPDMSMVKRMAILIALVAIGNKGPDVMIRNQITKRMEAIRLGLPDALDLLVICAESGLSVDAALTRLGSTLSSGYPELADEVSLTAIELGFLAERRQAYENLARRVPLDALQGICTTLIQTERYGTPLSSALRVLTAEFRNDRMMRAEAKAAKLPVLMTLPLVVFILPTLFILILGPAACSIADVMKKM